MVKQTGHRAADAGKAMRQMQLPAVDLAAENAELRSEVAQLKAEVAALKAQIGTTDQSNPAAAPAKIEPLPKELESTLGREAIWALVRPTDNTDDDGLLRRLSPFWESLDRELGHRDPACLRQPLQDLLDTLIGLELSREEKRCLVANINLRMRNLGLFVQVRAHGAVGTLVVYGPSSRGSLRIQQSVTSPDGKEGRKYEGLGVLFPKLNLVTARLRNRPLAHSQQYKYL